MRKIDWVFGYGSLIWDPGFAPAETARAWLTGYARSFCLRSIQHRGTASLPGLVLGLDVQPEAECGGLALRIADHDHDEVLAYLRARELVTDAYQEAILPLRLEDGRRVEALAYVMRRDHVQYAGGLPVDEQARIIAQAHGGRGPNADYLFNTAAHLAQIGLGDSDMDHLSDKVRRLLEQGINRTS
ncbi:gamma-glutamylcyclotransferase [Paracoccus sp. AK26]|uniref:gamma-glutamylcyclotransferase n=1 Tax=Paracoccus sp. AK26 TaxID=2589076 RepID=UPI001427FFD6|nr:gamma-glutamylcyclotransferase [Paracoccus sp. AK26]QIR85235.1 gamma-glutamylcyclotransferase [Paracoccus sp. AK26]